MKSLTTVMMTVAISLCTNAYAMSPGPVSSQVGAAGPAITNFDCAYDTMVHVTNAFDVAFQSAKDKALVDCAQKGYTAAQMITFSNDGMRGQGAGYPYLVCQVTYWYRCQ